MSGSRSAANTQRSTFWYIKNRQPFKGLHAFSDQLVTFTVNSYLHFTQERLLQLPRTTTHIFSFVFILSYGIVWNSQNWNDESRRLLASKSLWLFPAAVGNASRKVILNSRWHAVDEEETGIRALITRVQHQLMILLKLLFRIPNATCMTGIKLIENETKIILIN